MSTPDVDRHIDDDDDVQIIQVRDKSIPAPSRTLGLRDILKIDKVQALRGKAIGRDS
jgi:hypothetical protein